MSLFMSKKDKELLKHLDEEENELDSDFKEDDFKIWDLLKKDEDEELSDEFLSESEKEREENLKKEEKKIMITTVVIMSSIILVVFIGLSIFSYIIQSDLYKITKPIIEEHYKNNLNIKFKTKTIENICVNEKCSKIALLTTKDNHYIVTTDNKTFGDNYNKEKYLEEYNNYFYNYFKEIDFINNNPKLSYKDYYLEYNLFYDYIDILPQGMKINDLIKTKKLTVIDTIAFQGNYNLNKFKNYIKNLSKDSKLYLIQHEKGLPKTLIILTYNEALTLAIEGNYNLADGIKYFELEKSKNSVRKVDISSISSNSVVTNGKYKIINGYNIEINLNRQMENASTYYLLQFDNNKLFNADIFQLEYRSYNQEYIELSDYLYQNIIFFKTGGNTYLINDNNISFGYKKNNEPLACKLGLC